MANWTETDVCHLLAKIALGENVLNVQSQLGSGAFGTVWKLKVPDKVKKEPNKRFNSSSAGEIPPPGTIFSVKILSHEDEQCSRSPNTKLEEFLKICLKEVEIAVILGKYKTFPTVFFHKTFTAKSPRVTVIGMEHAGQSC
eukprot:861547_1